MHLMRLAVAILILPIIVAPAGCTAARERTSPPAIQGTPIPTQRAANPACASDFKVGFEIARFTSENAHRIESGTSA